MLNRLSVSNLAVIEKTEARFAPGLTVITGETGAGKSVLMSALELVLGGKVDGAAVRDGAVEAEIEAEFDDGHVVRRAISASSGRSRAWIDDEAASVADLRAFAAGRVDIHGPRANQSLLEESFQRDALDSLAHAGGCLTAYRAAYAAWRGVVDEIARLEGGGSVEEELDLLKYQVSELDEAGLSPEDETLAERHAAAAHTGEIVESANEATEALGGDRGAATLLAGAANAMRRAAKHLPAAGEWISEVEDLLTRVQELSRTVARAASAVDSEGENLDELDARLTLVNRLKRKYRVDSIPALLELAERKRARLDELEGRDARLEKLRAEVVAAESAMRKAGAELTELRTKAAGRFAAKVTDELHDLGFLKAWLSVEVEPREPDASGCDRVVYLFAPNPGEPVRPLASIASSGEIARVMLALKVVQGAGCRVQGAGCAPSTKHQALSTTLVFDEIDANIGGEVGEVVGEKLRDVARHRQVIAITHLPQSAVYGERHLVVSKAVSGGRTRSGVVAAEGAARVTEIARMLGDGRSEGIVRKHAEELLKHGKTEK